jgi:hypothetical protein
MESGGSDSYKYALADIVKDFVHEARTDEACSDPGYRSAMLHVLGHIKNEAGTFGLDLEYLGLADFDPELWFVQKHPVSK